MSELAAALSTMEPASLAQTGLVLEENLTDVQTYSAGRVRVADLIASYYGRQRLTVDNVGEQVYGGSDLVVVLRDFNVLLQLDLPDHVRVAVEPALTYDAATSLFPGMFASRRNYDIAQGLDATGQWRSGVLEQSWRLGGATGAEIATLEAFRHNSLVQVVQAATHEIYGPSEPPPEHATVYFRGVEERATLSLLTFKARVALA